MKAINQIKDREPLSITQISSINIFEPPSNMLPSGLLYDPSNNHIDHHQENSRISNYPLSRERDKLIVRNESPLYKQGEKAVTYERKEQNWETKPPSIEHIVIENQLNEEQRLPFDYKFKITDIFAGKQTLSSNVFPTQKSSLGREGVQKMQFESTKAVGKGSSVEVEAQCLQIEKKIALLQAENTKMHNLLSFLSKQKDKQNFTYGNDIDPFYVKFLIEQQLRARGVISK